jgi:hypothetical protein
MPRKTPRSLRTPLVTRLVLSSLIALVVCGAGIIGCAAESQSAKVLYVAFPPPPAPVELEGAPPSASYVWVSGHYDWNGIEYVWFPGQWESRPHARATWVSGRWQFTRQGWVWIDGHWS